MFDPPRTLWMVELRLDSRACQLFPVYAVTMEEAVQMGEALAEERGLPFVQVTNYPRGFMVFHSRIPGTRQENTPD